jgi:5-methylphenazine-1-carboxylate 1-monooxygenase
MDVIVLGGGIAGLTMALSLHQAGIPVRVYEASAELKPLGVGINLQPTAVRELTELGLAEDLASAGIAIGELSLFDKHGQLICSEPRGLSAGYRWPQYAIHRGRLQMLLLRVVRNRIGADRVRGGQEFTNFTQTGDRIVATLRDRSSETIAIEEADVLIGADGIHSAVRRQPYPNENGLRFGEQILWRFAVDAEPFLGGRTMAIVGHFLQRIIAYPIGPGAEAGRLETNCICQGSAPGIAPPREEWKRRVSNESVLASFGAWRFPWLDMPALVERASEIFEFPLADRDPVETRTVGRVTLIGDAAHPMQPTGFQAGSQAIIDARLLTGALVASPDPVEALRRYDRERRPVMNDITMRNRQFGPEAAMQLVEQQGAACT